MITKFVYAVDETEDELLAEEPGEPEPKDDPVQEPEETHP